MDKRGKKATIGIYGGKDGSNITRQDSHCTWLVKATCGSPGFTISDKDNKDHQTNMADHSSYTLYVVEYSNEFTTNATSPITLEDDVWLPKDFNSLQFYDDAAIISGEPGNFNYVDSDGAHHNIPGSVMVALNEWTEKTYSEYSKDLSKYNSARAAYIKDNTKNRPTA